MAGNQRTGKCYVIVDSQQFESMMGAKITLSNVERDDVIGTDVFGYSEKAVAPMITCEFAHGGGLDPIALHTNTTNSNITFECDTGETYILRQAWSAKQPTLTSGEGKSAFEFHGKSTVKQ